MTMVSYAQNFEDVMLARALADVEHGFYVDVGAQDPEDDSVTKHFYDRGWRGVNFEPSESYFARLQAERPRDINLCSAVGAKEGTVTFYEEEGTGLSTIVEAVSTSGRRVARNVPLTTLDATYAAHGIQIVHFLKIDVEGAEDLVLRGAGLSRVRPWIVLLEATKPNSTEPYFEHWESLLTDQDYDFVYADGLNRFYLAHEKTSLTKHFVDPPNHFDRFVRASEVKAEQRAEARWCDKFAHHLAIIDSLGEQRAGQQRALEEHAERIGKMAEQLHAQHGEIVRHADLLSETSNHAEALRLDGENKQVEIERLRAEGTVRQVEIERLRAEGVVRQVEIERLRGEGTSLEARRADLEDLATRRAAQVSFRDAKVAWLTLDRDRFRDAHQMITESLLWRLTTPLQGRRLRKATRAQLGYALPAPPVQTADSAPAAVAPPVELPDSAIWIARRLN